VYDREAIFGLTVHCSIDWRLEIRGLKPAITLPALHLTPGMYSNGEMEESAALITSLEDCQRSRTHVENTQTSALRS
jgi:hypothetical protein